jgi:HSP20 family protein
MKLSLPVCVAATAIPVAADAWSMGGPRGLFLPPMAARMLIDNMSAVENLHMMRQRMQQKRDCFNNAMMTRVPSPRYEIKDNDKEIQISIDVPGVKAEDIHVTIDEVDSVLSIQGQRESSDGTTTTTRRFERSISLDPSVDLEKFTATLDNGVLVITAPKDSQRIEKNLRRIPIVTTPGGGTTTAAAAVEDSPTGETPPDETIDLDDTSAAKQE